MKNITIENLSTCEILTLTTEEHLLNTIEDALYIQWELTPCTNRCSWAYPFLRGEKVRFSFHKVEFVQVWQDKDGKVWVKNI